MNRKLLPVFIMLLAGAIASIMGAIMQYDLKSFLLIVFITLVIFYILGSALKYVLDMIEKQNTKESLDQGEVIQKESTGNDTDEPAEEDETASQQIQNSNAASDNGENNGTL